MGNEHNLFCARISWRGTQLREVFQLLKRERMKKKTEDTREEARSNIFGYIEMFYNSEWRHGSNTQRLPAEYEINIIKSTEVYGLYVAISR